MWAKGVANASSPPTQQTRGHRETPVYGRSGPPEAESGHRGPCGGEGCRKRTARRCLGGGRPTCRPQCGDACSAQKEAELDPKSLRMEHPTYGGRFPKHRAGPLAPPLEGRRKLHWALRAREWSTLVGFCGCSCLEFEGERSEGRWKEWAADGHRLRRHRGRRRRAPTHACASMGTLAGLIVLARHDLACMVLCLGCGGGTARHG